MDEAFFNFVYELDHCDNLSVHGMANDPAQNGLRAVPRFPVHRLVKEVAFVRVLHVDATLRLSNVPNDARRPRHFDL